MRKFPVALSLFAALGLAACGGEDTPTKLPPAVVLEDPVGYFGMEPCTCYEYAPEDEWLAGKSDFSEKLGMAIENIGGQVQFGRPLHIVRYRLMGTLNRVVRQEYLDPTDPELLLYGVIPTGERNDPMWKFDPPASLVRGPVQSGTHVTMTLQTTKHTPPDTDEEGPEIRPTAQYRTEEEVEIGEWDEVEQISQRMTVTATPIAYTGARDLGTDVWNGQVRWFVPERGFVKMTLDLAGESKSWVLVRTRKLAEEACTPTGADPMDLCGS